MSAITTLWNGLPRAARWGVYAVGFVILYVAVIDRVLKVTATFRSDAEQIDFTLRRERDLSSPDSDDGKLLTSSRKVFGTPILPTDRNATPVALQVTVNRILRNHGIEDAASTEHTAPIQLKVGDPVASIVGPGMSLDRYTYEVTFESDPETAMSVISELESAPEITAIGRVRFDKGSARFGYSRSGASDDHDTVRVTLAPELWVQTRREFDGLGGGSP